jgi:hypothetical protein
MTYKCYQMLLLIRSLYYLVLSVLTVAYLTFYVLFKSALKVKLVSNLLLIN